MNNVASCFPFVAFACTHQPERKKRRKEIQS
jgi:hypothetical protein